MRILWLKSELLHPVDKGGKIRTYQMLKHLAREHEITYLTLVYPDDPPEALDRASEYCRHPLIVPHQQRPKSGSRFYLDLLGNLASPLPLALAKYRSAMMRRAIRSEVGDAGGGNGYDLIVCDFLTPSVNLTFDYPCRALLFEHNVEAMIWRRHAENQTNRAKRLYLHGQWRKMLRYERAACRRFDAVVAVSREDRSFIRERYGVDEVYDVPTGVDTEYFSPRADRVERDSLVFTGSMDWLPNEDAMVFFVEQVLPRVAAQIPDVKLKIVGRNPTPRILELARDHSRITVTGCVDDVRPHVARAAACIVPLRIGGGTRLKIYEAMAMGKAVVSTAVGAEGLPVRAGEELLIAGEPDEFAQAVIRTLTDEELNDRLSRNARAAVCERFGWDRAAAAFSQICERVAHSRKSGRVASGEWRVASG